MQLNIVYMMLAGKVIYHAEGVTLSGFLFRMKTVSG